MALLCCLVMPLCAQQTTNTDGNAPAAPKAEDAPRSFTSLVEGSVKDVLLDQRDIWTSPFHINRQTALPWILVGGTTAVLLAVDHPVSRAIPFSGTPNTVGTDISRFGQWYTVVPAGAAIFGAGWLSHDPKLTEMVENQERTLDRAQRKNLIFDIQRYLGEQQYYVMGPVGLATIAVQPWVKNFYYQSDYGRGAEYVPKLWLDGKPR